MSSIEEKPQKEQPDDRAAIRKHAQRQCPWDRDRDSRYTCLNTTRTCNTVADVHMYTSESVPMDMNRGTLARIDRRLLAGLGDDEAYRTLRVSATRGKWSTWKRCCDSVGVSIGRAVTMFIDRVLIGVFGDVTGVFAQRATEQLAIR